MGNCLRNFCSNSDDEILWFLILFLLLFWNGCGNRNNNNSDCSCNNTGCMNSCNC